MTILFISWVLYFLPPAPAWLTPRAHDFGLLQHNTPATHIFTFKNTGTTPLRVDVVRAECGCTAADWTEAPVAPDSTGQIRVEYDAAQIGLFHKKIKVFFDDIRKAEILSIEGEVE